MRKDTLRSPLPIEYIRDKVLHTFGLCRSSVTYMKVTAIVHEYERSPRYTGGVHSESDKFRFVEVTR